MYSEKMNGILSDLENKDIELAGGSVVGMILSTINSLIKYIANLTIGKQKYQDVQAQVQMILNNAENLKEASLIVVDKDKEVLEKLLEAYKTRKQNEEKYIVECKKAVEFCMEVVMLAHNTLKLSDDISKVGNKMLASDFEICKYYAYASVKAAIVNVNVNLESVKDENFRKQISDECNEILKKSKKYI